MSIGGRILTMRRTVCLVRQRKTFGLKELYFLAFGQGKSTEGQGHVEGQNAAFSHFGSSGRLDGLQRAQIHPVLLYI